MNPQSIADSIVQTVREPLVVLDSELRVAAVNRAFDRSFNVTPEETAGRVLYELGDGQWDIPALRNMLADVLLSNSEFNDYEVAHNSRIRGSWTMLLNGRRLYDGDRETKLILLAIEDITERRAAEYQLQMSEVRYRRLFEAAHDGILILDSLDRTITDVNPFLMELLDFPRDHFIGKELWEIGIFRDKDANQQAMQQLYEKGSIRFEDLPLQDRNGHRHPVEIVANIYQEDRTPVIQCNIRDISERAGFDRERAALLANEQASRMEAEAANRSKDLFLATLSHEVRRRNAIMAGRRPQRECDAATMQEGLRSSSVQGSRRAHRGRWIYRASFPARCAEICPALVDVIMPPSMKRSGGGCQGNTLRPTRPAASQASARDRMQRLSESAGPTRSSSQPRVRW